MNIIKLLVLPGFLFLIVVAFGYWVSKLGKPYHNLLFNTHKLIALGAVLLTGSRIFELDPFAAFPLSAILLVALSVLGVVGMFATGAIMSIQDEVPSGVRMVHRLIPGVIILSLLGAVYLITIDQLNVI